MSPLFPARETLQYADGWQMAMVSNKFLGFVAVKLGIHRHLSKYSSSLNNQIASYADEVETVESEGDETPDAWMSTSDPPKVRNRVSNTRLRLLELTFYIVFARHGGGLHRSNIR